MRVYIHPISSIARIGGVASQIIEMIPKMCGEDSTMDCTKIPYAIYGIMTILGCILMFALPETKDQSSPETISEGNQFGKVCFWRKFMVARVIRSGSIRFIGPTCESLFQKEVNKIQCVLIRRKKNTFSQRKP